MRRDSEARQQETIEKISSKILQNQQIQEMIEKQLSANQNNYKHVDQWYR